MKPISVILFFLVAIAIGSSGCKPKEIPSSVPDQAAKPATLQIAGRVFIVTKGSQNIVLGDVKVSVLDEPELWACLNTNAVKWTNTLAAEQAKVDLATTNYDALYKADFDKLNTAKKYHDNVLQTASPGSPEYEQSSDWSVKLQGQIDDLNEKKKMSDTASDLKKAIREREVEWNFINWPEITYLVANGCDCENHQTTTTDNEGRFKFNIPSTSSNVVLFAKAERQVGDQKEQYLWLLVIGTPVGGANGFGERSNLEWLPVQYLHDQPVEINLSNDNMSAQGLWHFLEDTNIVEYMIDYESKVETSND
jgi:hypothetical protein